MRERIENIRLYVGPVSKNVVEAATDFMDETEYPLGITATVNQGYYTGMGITDLRIMSLQEMIFCRDHCTTDPMVDGGFDLIHLDPWYQNNFFDAVDKTNQWMTSSAYYYEVGTEEAIYPYNADELDKFLSLINKDLVIYAVVQSGAKLQNGTNVGSYDETKLKETIKVCQKHGLLSKEHNGDYLDSEVIKQKFELGLNAINIAPEFGTIESNVIWSALNDEGKDKFYRQCLDSLDWRKWVSYDFDFSDKGALVGICGHYVFNTFDFQRIKAELDGVDIEIQKAIKNKLTEVCDVIYGVI